MVEKDPTSYALLTYLWVTALALWGGVVRYIQKLRAGETTRFNFTELVGELVISAFSGIITFYLCEAAELNTLITAGLVGISGHMGSRALFLVENTMKRRFGLIDDERSR